MRRFCIDMRFERVIADRVNRGSVDDTAHALLARGFVDVVAALNVRGEYLLPGAFERRPAKMNDRVDAFRGGLHGGEIGKLEDRDFLVGLRVRDLDAV